jgi:hypothetical protein
VEHLKLALPIFGRVEELALAHHFFYKGKCCMGSAWSAQYSRKTNCNPEGRSDGYIAADGDVFTNAVSLPDKSPFKTLTSNISLLNRQKSVARSSI